MEEGDIEGSENSPCSSPRKSKRKSSIMRARVPLTELKEEDTDMIKRKKMRKRDGKRVSFSDTTTIAVFIKDTESGEQNKLQNQDVSSKITQQFKVAAESIEGVSSDVNSPQGNSFCDLDDSVQNSNKLDTTSIHENSLCVGDGVMNKFNMTNIGISDMSDASIMTSLSDSSDSVFNMELTAVDGGLSILTCTNSDMSKVKSETNTRAAKDTMDAENTRNVRKGRDVENTRITRSSRKAKNTRKAANAKQLLKHSKPDSTSAELLKHSKPDSTSAELLKHSKPDSTSAGELICEENSTEAKGIPSVTSEFLMLQCQLDAIKENSVEMGSTAPAHVERDVEGADYIKEHLLKMRCDLITNVEFVVESPNSSNINQSSHSSTMDITLPKEESINCNDSLISKMGLLKANDTVQTVDSVLEGYSSKTTIDYTRFRVSNSRNASILLDSAGGDICLLVDGEKSSKVNEIMEHNTGVPSVIGVKDENEGFVEINGEQSEKANTNLKVNDSSNVSDLQGCIEDDVIEMNGGECEKADINVEVTNKNNTLAMQSNEEGSTLALQINKEGCMLALKGDEQGCIEMSRELTEESNESREHNDTSWLSHGDNYDIIDSSHNSTATETENENLAVNLSRLLKTIEKHDVHEDKAKDGEPSLISYFSRNSLHLETLDITKNESVTEKIEELASTLSKLQEKKARRHSYLMSQSQLNRNAASIENANNCSKANTTTATIITEKFGETIIKGSQMDNSFLCSESFALETTEMPIANSSHVVLSSSVNRGDKSEADVAVQGTPVAVVTTPVAVTTPRAVEPVKMNGIDGCTIEKDLVEEMRFSFDNYIYHKFVINFSKNKNKKRDKIIDIIPKRNLKEWCEGEEYFISFMHNAMNIPLLKKEYNSTAKLSELVMSLKTRIHTWDKVAYDIYYTFKEFLGRVNLQDNHIIIEFFIENLWSMFSLVIDFDNHGELVSVCSLKHGGSFDVLNEVKTIICSTTVEDDMPVLSCCKSIESYCKDIASGILYPKRQRASLGRVLALDFDIFNMQ